MAGDAEARWKSLLEGLPRPVPEAAREDEEFHLALSRGLGNVALTRILADIDERIHFVRLSDITNPERFMRTCRDHLAIIGALRKGDRAAAVLAMRRNIEWGKSNVETAIRDALVRAHLSV